MPIYYDYSCYFRFDSFIAASYILNDDNVDVTNKKSYFAYNNLNKRILKYMRDSIYFSIYKCCFYI